MSKRRDKMFAESRELGWKECVAALEQVRKRGQDNGKSVAHVSEEGRRSFRYHDDGGESFFAKYFIPFDLRSSVYRIGFDEGVEAAKAEAWRIGKLIEQQKPKPKQATPVITPTGNTAAPAKAGKK